MVKPDRTKISVEQYVTLIGIVKPETVSMSCEECNHYELLLQSKTKIMVSFFFKNLCYMKAFFRNV